MKTGCCKWQFTNHHHFRLDCFWDKKFFGCCTITPKTRFLDEFFKIFLFYNRVERKDWWYQNIFSFQTSPKNYPIISFFQRIFWSYLKAMAKLKHAPSHTAYVLKVDVIIAQIFHAYQMLLLMTLVDFEIIKLDNIDK